MLASTLLISLGPKPVTVLLCLGLVKEGPISAKLPSSGADMEGRLWWAGRASVVAIAAEAGDVQVQWQGKSKEWVEEKILITIALEERRDGGRNGVPDRRGLLGNKASHKLQLPPASTICSLCMVHPPQICISVALTGHLHVLVTCPQPCIPPVCAY